MTSYHDYISGSDIRGVAMGISSPINNDFAKKLGNAFVQWLRRNRKNNELNTIAICRDSRISGPDLVQACAEGIAFAGINVYDFGLCTTPAMFQCLMDPETRVNASIMVTASHHPSDRNGFKFFTPESGIAADDLSEIVSLMDYSFPNVNQGKIRALDYLPIYKKHLQDTIRKQIDSNVLLPLLGLHIVVDAGNGAGGFFRDTIAELGAWTEGSQFLEPDGRFPNHAPNPEDESAMASISLTVLQYGADLGCIFDADCDRAALVDQDGKEINRNRLIALVSAVLLDKEPGLTIVTDSVTSSGLTGFIGEWGGEHYRYKRGYRNVINEAKRLNLSGINCPLAIETSGHAALRDNHFLDDGMYLCAMLIGVAMRMKQQGKNISSLLEGLQEPVEALELRLKIKNPDFHKAGVLLIQSVIDHANKDPAWKLSPDNREGVRIRFNLKNMPENGWFLLRLSIHDPVMPLNIESDIKGGVQEILRELYAVIKTNNDIDLTPIQKLIQV